MKLLLIEGCLPLKVRMERLLGDIPAIKLIGSASDTVSGLQLLALQNPDVVVIDVCAPISEAIEFISTITQRYPALLVVALTNCDVPGAGQMAQKAGAHLCADIVEELGSLDQFLSDCADQKFPFTDSTYSFPPPLRASASSHSEQPLVTRKASSEIHSLSTGLSINTAQTFSKQNSEHSAH
jgi:DNA-binding NarL/FixJ family response regulator